ncbi:MAG: multicopper oxidase family protein [Pyrinomonadaceae bacterium]|nr:multicopper oxidase family protein [Pyrinomonadaceae bacterium]
MKRKNRLGPSREGLKPTASGDQETKPDSDPKSGLGRRGFLKAGAGAAVVALVTPTESVAAPEGGVRVPPQRPPRLLGECNDVVFSEPKAVVARTIGGRSVLNLSLTAEPLSWTYQCPDDTPETGLQPTYNGAVPGPSMYVDPGTRIEIKLTNNLDAMPPFSGDNCPGGHHTSPPTPACFQHTNLHTHGLQVSPCSISSTGAKHCGPYAIDGVNPPLRCSSDDVLIDIFPGQSNKYCIVLPNMHAPGTNWYHSHLHGASAYQVSGGMAGALIIREPPAAALVREDLDKVFVLQEVLLNPTPLPPIPPVYGSVGAMPDTQVFVNGLCRPTLKMLAGQTMRWRFINATGTPRGLMKLRLVKTQTCSSTFPANNNDNQLMHLIAIDGISFYGVNPQPVRYHLMGPGSRADFLINITEPGLYTLLKDGFPLESVLNPTSTNFTNASAQSKDVLAYIDVQPSRYRDVIPKIIPGKKPAYLNPIWRVDYVRPQPIKFQNTAPGTFQVDNAFYDANVPIKAKLNTAEEWTLQNIGFAGAPQTNTHPFHVHINPFQINGIAFDFEVADADRKVPRMNWRDPCTWPFWDTIPIPAQMTPGTSPPGQLKIRSRFLIYDGEYVTHCHILVHEDVGMMINVKLIGSGIGPNVPVLDYPAAAKACIRRTSRCPGDTIV